MEVDATVAFTVSGGAQTGSTFLSAVGPGDNFVRYRRLCTATDLNAQWPVISLKRSLLCHIVCGSK